MPSPHHLFPGEWDGMGWELEWLRTPGVCVCARAPQRKGEKEHIYYVVTY